MAAETATSNSALLAVRDLVKVYRGSPVPAVDGLSVEVPRGDVLGLLGPNGAGKTTAISIMTTLLRPTSGTVCLNGVDVWRHAGRVRPKIGVVPQDIALYPSLTGRENLMYFARLYRLGKDKCRDRVDACLQMMGLDASADRRVETYSGGMKRRANLGVGLLHDPQILFLDEPTVGIDAQSRAMILERLQKLREQGMTMVYTTHYMEEAQQMCSIVAIMDEGKIVVQGRLDELFDQYPDCGNLEDVYLKLTGKHLRD